MRFLRVLLAALMISAMVTGMALAADPVTATDPATATDPVTSADPVTATDTGTSVVDEVYGEHDSKLGGIVVSITPPEGENPGTLVLNVAGKEVTVSYTAAVVEGEIAVGSYVEIKGSSEGIEKIEVGDSEEAQGSEVKSFVSSVTPGTDAATTTFTLMIGDQAVTYTAEELGIPFESIGMVTVGAEFKLSSEDGKTEMKISSESGTIKVEVKEDGTVEVKIDEGKPGKGEETSAEKKAEADEHKAEADEHKAEAKAKKDEMKVEKKGEKKHGKKVERDDD